MKEISNPPAFPSTGEGFGNPQYSTMGMTLRDWFAGQALSGLSSAADATGMCQTDAGGVAWRAYECADAMLAERAKGGEA